MILKIDLVLIIALHYEKYTSQNPEDRLLFFSIRFFSSLAYDLKRKRLNV